VTISHGTSFTDLKCLRGTFAASAAREAVENLIRARYTVSEVFVIEEAKVGCHENDAQQFVVMLPDGLMIPL
jgi:hypothetical protein